MENETEQRNDKSFNTIDEFLPNSIGALKEMAIMGMKKMLIMSETIPTLAETKFLLRFLIWSMAERAKKVRFFMMEMYNYEYLYTFTTHLSFPSFVFQDIWKEKYWKQRYKYLMSREDIGLPVKLDKRE